MTRRARAYLALMTASVGRGVVLRLLALQLVVAATESLGLVLLVPVLQALDGRTSLSLPGLGGGLSVPVAFALVVGVVTVRAWGQWRVAVVSVDVRLRTVDDLRLGLVDDLYAADWAFLARQRRSHVVQRLTTEVERAQLALVLLLRIIVGSLVLLATLGVALVLSPAVGGLVILGLVLVVALARRSVKTAVNLGEVMTQRSEGFGAALADSLASVRLMRAHDASVAWSQLVSEEAGRVRDVRRTFVQKSAGVVAALGVVAVLAVLGLILVGRAAGMNAAELAALAVVATRMLTSAQTLVGAVQSFANEAPALDRLTEFRAEVQEHREPGRRPPSTSGPDITGPVVSLRDVSVRYAPDLDPVLVEVSLDVPRDGLVVVSGPSGAGKSTLLDVVLGLLRPDDGELVVDGAPVTDLAAWRRRVGYVPQQTVLVPGTVWQNLVWSLPPGRTVTEDDAWNALSVACLDDVVRGLRGGLEAPLHELAELSGGEQQRLSIARAVIREPDLLVLDEATSGLDPATESRVLQRLLDGSRAVLLVTHRLPGHVRPDVSVQLDDGRLVDLPPTP